jgi:Ni/Co efflux regulator RcnB
MIKKTILSALVLATFAASALTTAGTAQAQQYDGDQPQWQRHGDRRGPPPPPPPQQQDRDRHHRHHNNGGVIAGGIAAGVIGGLLGGALANGNGGYQPAPPPPPPPPPEPECWYQKQAVQNQYDDGFHYERVRVCN